jgi:hypothetical protein
MLLPLKYLKKEYKISLTIQDWQEKKLTTSWYLPKALL